LKKLRFVITGNPGVGKHTTAKIIAEKTHAEIIDINKVAIDNNAIGRLITGLMLMVKGYSGCLRTSLRRKEIW
jgi:adenylate kinase family enzyme